MFIIYSILCVPFQFIHDFIEWQNNKYFPGMSKTHIDHSNIYIYIYIKIKCKHIIRNIESCYIPCYSYNSLSVSLKIIVLWVNVWETFYWTCVMIFVHNVFIICISPVVYIYLIIHETWQYHILWYHIFWNLKNVENIKQCRKYDKISKIRKNIEKPKTYIFWNVEKLKI